MSTSHFSFHVNLHRWCSCSLYAHLLFYRSLKREPDDLLIGRSGADPEKMVTGLKPLTIPRSLNCKSKNVVYLWLCKLCSKTEAYFGRTTQECRDRTSGHRSCFNDESKVESVLSMHARDKHIDNFSLENFSIAVAKKVSPFRFIEKYKYRTIPYRLRYKV